MSELGVEDLFDLREGADKRRVGDGLVEEFDNLRNVGV